MLDGEPLVRVPEVEPRLSTHRLLSMGWLDGGRLLDYRDRPLDERNRIARAMFRAWWFPFAHYGVIHGDPHLGNYTVFETEGAAGGINLLDYGCIRIFPPSFVSGVVDLFHGLSHGDDSLVVAAYESWGFAGLSRELIDALNIWARFIYAPLLDDRVRTIADGVAPAEYGRREAYQVHQVLKAKGPVTVPREFVFMDRAAIGLGAVFLHLKAEMNFHRLFVETIENFDVAMVGNRQQAALGGVGLA
jgi:predicted unusual protein kinase regulating ubiquinone biosynthesis (AarF/ABC1/UbiB family)